MLEKGSGSQAEPLTPIVPAQGSVGTPLSQMRRQAQAQSEEAALAQGLRIHRLAEHDGASEAGVLLPGLGLDPHPGPAMGSEGGIEAWAPPGCGCSSFPRGLPSPGSLHPGPGLWMVTGSVLSLHSAGHTM